MKRMTVENFGKSDDDHIEIWGRCWNEDIHLGDVLTSSYTEKRLKVEEIIKGGKTVDVLYRGHTASVKFLKFDRKNPNTGEMLVLIHDKEKLIQAVRKIIRYCDADLPIDDSSTEWLNLKTLFSDALEEAESSEISDAIDFDIHTDLPFHIGSSLHQKLILLEDENPNRLIDFAEYLRLKDDSWKYLANYLERTAEKLE
jgi:hypothetical protein